MRIRKLFGNKSTSSVPARGTREGSIWELFLFAVLFVLAFSAIARADGMPRNSMATSVAIPAASAFSYTAGLDWTTARKLLDNEENKPGYSAAYESVLTATHKTSGLTLMADLEYDQEYTYVKDDGSTGSFANPVFGLSKTWKNKKDFSSPVFDSMTLSLRGALPGNQAAYDKTFEGSYGPGFAVAKKLGRFSLGQKFSYSHSVFQYQSAGAEGDAVNSPDSYSSKFSIAYAITDNLTLRSVWFYAYSIPYYGVGKGLQDVMAGINYKINAHYSVAMGIDTTRGTSAEDQQEQVRVYDENSTQAFVTLSVSI